MGFWRELFRRGQPDGPGDTPPEADVELEDRVLSSPSEVELLERAEEGDRSGEGDLTRPPGETW